MKNWHNPNPKNLQLRMSDCCQSKVLTVPACFGDPEIHVCDKCNKGCTPIFKPLYEEVSKGTFRRIEYPNFENLKV